MPISISSLRSCPPWKIYLGFVFRLLHTMSLWITTGPSKRPSSQASIIKTPAGQSQETMALSSPLQTCLECGASARKERAIEARLYGRDGVHPIEHWTKKCSNRSCATLHHYNYRWVDGNKTRSTARVPEILTLFTGCRQCRRPRKLRGDYPVMLCQTRLQPYCPS